MVLYGGIVSGDSAWRCRTVDFRHRGVSGHGALPVGSADADSPEGWLAQDVPGFGAASERLPYRAAAVADAATPWPVAIDWHLQPHYGQPYKSRNEIYYSKPK